VAYPNVNTQGRQSSDDQTADGIPHKRGIGFYEGLAMLGGSTGKREPVPGDLSST
jgi:hypothetical protein